MIKYIPGVILIIFLMPVIPLKAEYLFLKDGTIIKGKIVNETANDVVISDEQNKVVAYPHNKIMRVLYTEINMGKIYVQLKNGENFRGYLIDEDRDTYTFRHVINKPEEFTVQRSKVLFIAERNPSELKGESSYTEISLTWSPPYDKMKFYNIYYKKKKNDKYILADKAWKNSFNLKGLNNFTKYFIMVTGVDDTGVETTPSNEIEITTLARVDVELKNGKTLKTNLVAEDWEKYTFRNNIRKAEDFTVKRADVLFITERFPSGLKGSADFNTISLKWIEPYDSVNEYKIYIKKKSEDYKPFSTTGNNSKTVKDLAANTEYSVKVTGILKDKTETTPSNEIKLITGLEKPQDKNLLPSGIRIAYMLGIPFTLPQRNIYSNLHGVDVNYSYFFSDYISIKTGVNFVIGTQPVENATTVQSALNIGVNFGFPVKGFIYPYTGVSVRGIWLHEECRGRILDFGGIGVDWNLGIAFTIVKFFGLYTEYTLGWSTALDKSKTDISSMSIKAGVFFRF